MKEFQAKRRFRRFIYSPLSILVLALLFLILIRSTAAVAKRSQAARAARATLEQEVAELEARKASLAGSLGQPETERGGEEFLRDKFSVVREGEGVIAIVDDPKAKSAELAPPPSQTWWDRFKKFLARD